MHEALPSATGVPFSHVQTFGVQALPFKVYPPLQDEQIFGLLVVHAGSPSDTGVPLEHMHVLGLHSLPTK